MTATLTALRESPATARQKAKFILATDGRAFEAENLVDGETVVCDYPNFEECRTILAPLDSQGILTPATNAQLTTEVDELDNEALLASLGVDATPDDDITQLTHVRSSSVAGGKSRQEIKAAEEIAQRTPCPDFKQCKPIFKQVQQDLDSGVRQTLKYQDNAAVNQGDLFILDGQKVLVAEMGEIFVGDHGRPNARLRVIYDNGTESNLLLRSLQRASNKDKVSRRITTPDLGPLFSDTEAEDDLPTGYIYVLRSQSDDPYIAKHRSVIHKIGVTGGDVKKRIANAKKDPTYLLAEVEVVATFNLSNINRKGLETLLHKFFDSARLDMELQDRFGIPVKPKEWFLLPLGAIEEAIEKIKTETLNQFRYAPETAAQKPQPRNRSADATVTCCRGFCPCGLAVKRAKGEMQVELTQVLT